MISFDAARLTLIAALLAALCAARPAQAAADSEVCERETARQEKLQAIPDRLLHAISLVESGRWDSARQATLAWPWTVMAEGEGRFLPTKQAAITEVLKLQARGVRNIDVGCMQVNLLAHPDAFASLEEAFDPATNVAYAARFLKELYGQDGNWGQAGAHYHSQTPELAAPYKAKLLAVWDSALRHGGMRIEMAALDPAGPTDRQPLGIMMPSAPQSAAASRPTAARPADALARTAQERAAARRVADAYRQAKLAEYRQRKLGLGNAG